LPMLWVGASAGAVSLKGRLAWEGSMVQQLTFVSWSPTVVDAKNGDAPASAWAPRPVSSREVRCSPAQTPWGRGFAGWWDGALCFLALCDDPAEGLADLVGRWPDMTLHPSNDIARVGEDAEGAGTLAIVLRGTPFQHRVWQALCTVPRGERVSYRWLAEAAGYPRAVRAVGSAVGRNPVAGYVPCHRVVRADGGWGGYRWGLDRKRAILAQEQSTAGRTIDELRDTDAGIG
jgi:O-6-methylguanine DNA methyltransferase